ncbi:hypothetical protein P22_2927 [Propionispora sp. 2/2-37]|uniref:YibE/F family protein n=1 Tax=Propionispora sp. 2/2-37 TaxID=1677858 RepID=UPI0006BB578E|nr:YibE/F family protein [Propionispora sp. 2/2-37]CUH96816.1 hypothetical protein P22_2927 [Propionispora sp. 2/2-37]
MQAISRIGKKELFTKTMVCLLTIVLALFLHWFNHTTEKVSLVNTAGRTFEKATVVEIVTDNLAEDGNRYGNQQVRLQMATGPNKGKIVDAVSPDGMLFGTACRPGMSVITISSVNGDASVTTVYSRDREWVVFGFLLIFLLLLALIGGKSGIKSALGLIFTFVCIFYLLLPMIYRGISPFLSAITVSFITTFVTLYLIGGWTGKTVCAVTGSLGGVLIAGISAWLFGLCAGINGYNVGEIENLLFLAQNTPVRIGELLFAGILISALGAVMDISMSIASAVNEIYDKKPDATVAELFASGMTIGRDTMGTMCNTLILAFTGSSLGLLMLNYSYDLPYLQLINSYNIGIEIMQGISGTIGIILTVPLVSFLSSMIIPKWH